MLKNQFITDQQNRGNSSNLFLKFDIFHLAFHIFLFLFLSNLLTTLKYAKQAIYLQLQKATKTLQYIVVLNMLKIRCLFSQIKRDQILNSSYEQLVDRIARTYNLKQYKNQSGLCLLEMHHQFQLFKPGDWVLDVGSGLNYAWTDLTLKLTQNDSNTNRVISSDILDLKKNRQNNVFIRGDITEEPIQTKIALELQNHNLDTILVDVSPQFTGNVNNDGRYIMTKVGGVLDIAHNFLKKGGTFVCKVLQSEAQPLIDEAFKIYFHEKYKYVPSVVRKTSPVCFYVMKGFLISQSYTALTDFLNQYKGSTERKIKLVQKYQGKYSWDPVKTIRKQIFHDIVKMQSEGRSDKDILKVYATDPYAKVQKTLKLLKQAEQAKNDRNMVLHSKILNQLTEGQLFKNAQDFPTTGEQFYEMVLESMDKVIKQDKQKKIEKKQKISRAPLKENQAYMKAQDKVKQTQVVTKNYLPGDLQGRYSGAQTKEQAELQVQKIQTIHPQIKRLVSQMEDAEKQSSQKTIQDILQQNKHKYQQLSAESLRNVQQAVEQSVRRMSFQDIQEEKKLERQIFRQNSNQQKQQKADRWINQRRSKRKKPLF